MLVSYVFYCPRKANVQQGLRPALKEPAGQSHARYTTPKKTEFKLKTERP